jgi:hypothetical protein
MSLLELDGIGVPFSTASIITLHSWADSQTFSLVVRDSLLVLLLDDLLLCRYLLGLALDHY